MACTRGGRGVSGEHARARAGQNSMRSSCLCAGYGSLRRTATPRLQFYSTAVGYWDKQEASVNGVLGGYGHLSGPDVRDSRAFLKKVCPPLEICLPSDSLHGRVGCGHACS